MNLDDIKRRLDAPFSSHLILWTPTDVRDERNQALLRAHIDVRTVQDRLDAICPDAWSFTLDHVAGAEQPTLKGRLTILGVSREDIGESAHGSFKAAASDALKRCAVQFGIGRYLDDLPKIWADWHEEKRQPVKEPELPEWARPDFERSPGGAQIVQALEQLKYELPADIDLQREVYRHLKAALQSLEPQAAI